MREIGELSPDEVAERLAAPGKVQLVDVREREEWDVCRLPGAVLLPLATLPDQAREVLDPELPIICYCHHGVRSHHAAMWLASSGFREVAHLHGGIDRWAREREPEMARY